MSKAPPHVPARLYVILAREAPVGVVFRRGPSKWVQIIKWNTETDTFEPGQWFHGRIYENRCDLSPDGKLLVYFASDQRPLSKSIRPDVGVGQAWTAISKPPYLTALAIWPNGGTWEGGSLFVSNNEVQISGYERRDVSLPVSLKAVPYILSARYEHDGWKTIQNLFSKWPISKRLRDAIDRISLGLPIAVELSQTVGYDDPADVLWSSWPIVLYEKTSQAPSHLVLRMVIEHVRSDESVMHTITDAAGNNHPIANAEWADIDKAGRIVFARDGKLFAASIDGGALVERELADFNANRFEPVEAPAWAKEW